MRSSWHGHHRDAQRVAQEQRPDEGGLPVQEHQDPDLPKAEVMSVGPPMPHQNRCGPCQWVHLQRSARLEHSDSPPLVIVECSQHGPCHSRGAKKRGDRLEAMDMNTEHGSDRSVAGAVPAAHPKVGSSCQA